MEDKYLEKHLLLRPLERFLMPWFEFWPWQCHLVFPESAFPHHRGLPGQRTFSSSCRPCRDRVFQPLLWGILSSICHFLYFQKMWVFVEFKKNMYLPDTLRFLCSSSLSPSSASFSKNLENLSFFSFFTSFFVFSYFSVLVDFTYFLIFLEVSATFSNLTFSSSLTTLVLVDSRFGVWTAFRPGKWKYMNIIVEIYGQLTFAAFLLWDSTGKLIFDFGQSICRLSLDSTWFHLKNVFGEFLKN